MKSRIILASLAALALASAAGAGKISATAHFAKPDPTHMIEVGDQPNHSLGVSKASCTWTKPMEIGGAKSRDGWSVTSEEVTGDKYTGSGFHQSTMDNGDKYDVSYSGTAMLKDGAAQTAQGKWRFTGGTGKLKGITGQGTYQGKADADGTMTYQVEGEYQLPK